MVSKFSDTSDGDAKLVRVDNSSKFLAAALVPRRFGQQIFVLTEKHPPKLRSPIEKLGILQSCRPVQLRRDHEVNAGILDDAFEALAEAMLPAWAFVREGRAQKTLSPELRKVTQVLNDMVVHRHHNFLPGFLLMVNEDPALRTDMLPFHVNTVGQSGSDEVTEKDEGLPFDRRCGIQELLHIWA